VVQNIDPLYILQPVITILFTVALVVYWHYRRSFTRIVLVYSAVAYIGAMTAKLIVQVATFGAFRTRFSDNPIALGAYVGAQTVLFEVGGAFLVAAWAVSRAKINAREAPGYGLGLAMWENVGYLGTLGLVSLIAVYVLLASNSPVTQEFYSSLISTRPDLFYPSSQALPLIGYGLMERLTSLLFHFSWGWLCFLAAYVHKKLYFLLALPMGLVDFIVPFEGSLTIPIFETLIFVLDYVL